MKSNSIALSDGEAIKLWLRFRQGEVEAWSDLLEGHYRTLFNYGWRLEADRELLHDCIHDLFINLWDGRETLNPAPKSVTFYLFRAFRNLLLKELKKQNREQCQPSVPDTLATPPVEDWLVDQESSHLADARLRHLLSNLPAREQEALFLKYYENLSNQQIAELMTIRKQSVANLLNKSLLHLRQHWEVKFGTSSLLGLLLFYWRC